MCSNPVVVNTADEARAVINKVADHGADFIKVYENLSRESYFAIIDEAKRRKIPVVGHVPFRVLPKEAADAGQRTFEHVLAMALGCSTKAESEREEFARILSDPTLLQLLNRRHWNYSGTNVDFMIRAILPHVRRRSQHIGKTMLQKLHHWLGIITL